MIKIKTTVYLIPESHKWIKERAEKQGLSMNDYIQLLINKEMEKLCLRKALRIESIEQITGVAQPSNTYPSL